MQISYEKKAPAFANVDNIEDKLMKHYGKMYTDYQKFNSEVIHYENTQFQCPGAQFGHIKGSDLRDYKVQFVSLADQSFHEQNYFAQAVLPFFVDGASQIDPNRYWKYFLVYEQNTDKLVALCTVFEAHHHAEKFRLKISQVLVLPPYQRRGIGAKLYELVYEHYREHEPKCFEIIVEDASDDFQKVQDCVNAKVLLKVTKASNTSLQGPVDVNKFKQLAKEMKLPW